MCLLIEKNPFDVGNGCGTVTRAAGPGPFYSLAVLALTSL